MLDATGNLTPTRQAAGLGTKPQRRGYPGEASGPLPFVFVIRGRTADQPAPPVNPQDTWPYGDSTVTAASRPMYMVRV